MELLTPPNALIVTLTGGFLLLLIAFVLRLGIGVYDTALPVSPGKEVGFDVAPNWFIVYLILFPPYVFLFGQVISNSKAFFAEATQPKKGLITNEEGLELSRGEVFRKWQDHLRPLSFSLCVLLIGVMISSILQWLYGCLGVYLRSESTANPVDQAAVLDGEVVDWSTLTYVQPSTEWAKITTLLFSAGAFAYMAIALFVYLAILAYYVFVCWFVMRLASDTVDSETRLIIRGNRPFNYFSELFNYIFAAIILGLSAGYCMRLQAQYLSSGEATIFAYAFTDFRCVVGVLKGGSLSDCRLPKTWHEVASAIGNRETASSLTAFGEAVYTFALFATSISLLWRAFNLTKANYLERIADPHWQRAVNIKYDASFVETIDNSTFFSTIAPNYMHLSAALGLLAVVITVPYLGAVYLMTVVYAFTSLIRNRRRGVDLRPTVDSIYTESPFKGTALAEVDRNEIVLFLGFHHSDYGSGSFLEHVVEEAAVPKKFRDHIKNQIRNDPDPPTKLVEVALSYEPLDAGRSTVLGNILVAMFEKVGLEFGCFIAMKSKSCGLIRDPAVLARLNTACVGWRDAKNK
ncbi:MAG TPA: hypothetical protein VKY22_13680 [Bradyrhizobium sp.]|nr:hypothetical protein [Bradyrhizobium sp.]